ncbi:MAG: hypothetical protein P4L98_05630 [Ancalomicrobiaceae bacterium]|nr:hypothetical protein [Ancalomicrobiaceae bacterium]
MAKRGRPIGSRNRAKAKLTGAGTENAVVAAPAAQTPATAAAEMPSSTGVPSPPVDDDELSLDTVPMTPLEIAAAINDPGKRGSDRVRTLSQKHGILDANGMTTLKSWRQVERIVQARGRMPVVGAKRPTREATKDLAASATALEREREAKANLAELKAAKEAGELIDREAALATCARIYSGVRNRLECLPASIAGTLVGLDAAAIERRLEAEFEKLLKDLEKIDL